MKRDRKGEKQCVCVCVCVRERERERRGETGKGREFVCMMSWFWDMHCPFIIELSLSAFCYILGFTLQY